MEDRNVYGILETMDVDTGERGVRGNSTIPLKHRTGPGAASTLIFNRRGRIYRYELVTGTTSEIYSGAITQCNNDHVLSPDGKSIALNDAVFEDGLSRIYLVPLAVRLTLPTAKRVADFRRQVTPHAGCTGKKSPDWRFFETLRAKRNKLLVGCLD
jgi:hypothetical protein